MQRRAQVSHNREIAEERARDDIGVLWRATGILAVAMVGIVLMVLDEELMWDYGDQYLCV